MLKYMYVYFGVDMCCIYGDNSDCQIPFKMAENVNKQNLGVYYTATFTNYVRLGLVEMKCYCQRLNVFSQTEFILANPT